MWTDLILTGLKMFRLLVLGSFYLISMNKLLRPLTFHLHHLACACRLPYPISLGQARQMRPPKARSRGHLLPSSKGIY